MLQSPRNVAISPSPLGSLETSKNGANYLERLVSQSDIHLDNTPETIFSCMDPGSFGFLCLLYSLKFLIFSFLTRDQLFGFHCPLAEFLLL